jgi:signal transduction histidine kinase
MVVEDASKDSRFSDNPLVTSGPSIRFYAGAPLKTADGHILGTLCAIDSKPRELCSDHRQLLMDLSRLVVDEMELRVALTDAIKKVAEEVKTRAIQDEFLSTVSHELRTPLTSIRAALGLLQSEAFCELPDQAADLVSIAERNSIQLICLINDLLDLQKLDSGKMTFDFVTFDPCELAKETCENLASHAEDSNVRLKFECAETLSITGDPARIRQALTNLISNAIKYSPVKGVVRITATSEENSLSFAVADTGPGIPESYQPYIFERFSQANCSDGMKGTGLGLAITKTIAEAHNGSVTFTTKEGHGTTFQLRLPLRQSLARPSTAARS